MERGATIAAIATAPGRGGVAIVRVSGDRAFALAEAYPETTEHKSALKIYRWNDADKDAKEIAKEYKANPRGFFAKNKHNIYAVCYGVALPPEWEQNATK